MTRRELFWKVENKELRGKLFANTPTAALDDELGVITDSECLRGAFIWDGTEEGHAYWGRLNDSISREGSFDAGWNPLHPTKTSTMVMERAGFKIPITIRPSKPDPRGTEYGYFVVENTDNKYTVTKCDKHRNTEWSATFSEDSFLAWAKEYT